jgi:hypothetical protein
MPGGADLEAERRVPMDHLRSSLYLISRPSALRTVPLTTFGSWAMAFLEFAQARTSLVRIMIGEMRIDGPALTEYCLLIDCLNLGGRCCVAFAKAS